MYPTLSHLIESLTGKYIPLPIHTFGLMVAIAFLSAAYVLSKELRRKEKEGLLFPVTKKILLGAPATLVELFINGLVWFVIGYKLIGFAMGYADFVDDPQSYLLSMQGSWLGGIFGAGLGIYLKYAEKQKGKLDKPKWETVTIHPYQMVGDITIYAALGGIIGAKIFHNLEYPQEFLSDPIGALLSFSGLTYYGGLIGGAIAVIWYARKNNIKTVHLLDAAAPGLMLSYGVGRIGCQLSGDGDWGIVNTSPQPKWMSFLPEWFWKFDYPHNVINEGIPIPDCVSRFCYVLPQTVYPTALYESIACILLFILLMAIRKHIKVPALLFCIYLFLNGVERFFIEKIRVNSEYDFGFMSITQAEIISFVLMIVSASVGIWLYSRYKQGKVVGV